MFQTDVGLKAASGWQLVPVGMRLGSTVTIAVIGGDPLACYGSTSAPPLRTISQGSSQSFTSPLWISAAGGRSTIQITGGGY